MKTWHHTLHLDHFTQCDLIREVLSRCQGVRLTVTGPSMAPSIDSGDAILLRAMHAEKNLCIGHVYLFMAPGGRIYAHRLMRMEMCEGETHFVFKGDGLTLCDPIVPREAILGVVTTVYHRRTVSILPLTMPYLGRLFAMLNTVRPWLGVIKRKVLA